MMQYKMKKAIQGQREHHARRAEEKRLRKKMTMTTRTTLMGG